MFEWIKKHILTTGLLCCLIFLLPMLIVHILFQWDSRIPWLEAKTWNAGDVLSYISGCMTLLGTLILGAITVNQSHKAQEVNKKLTEENLCLQKIMAQNLYPIVAIDDAITFSTEEVDKNYSFPFWCNKKQFAVVGILGPRNSQSYLFDIHLNYDGDDKKFKYKKIIEFSLCNLSSAVIRYISFDRIHIHGDMGIQYIECVNTNSASSGGSGCSTLLKQGDSHKGRITIFFNNSVAKEVWDNSQRLNGVGMEIYITNKSITNVEFKEVIRLEFSTLTNNFYTEYWEDTFIETHSN